MIDDPHVQWFEQNEPRVARWLSRQFAPPRRIVLADDGMRADQAMRHMTQGTALLWRGDYHNARNLLQAVGRRLQSRIRPLPAEATLLERFHAGRQQSAQQAAVLARLLLPVGPGYQLPVSRAPDITEAAAAAWGPFSETGLLPLREVLGLIGAWQWQQRGVPVPALGGATIHPHYGVFAPIRSEYLDLVARAPLPRDVQLAWDIGTGTGVIAAILARRGVPRVLATDLHPAALDCAADNLQRLGLTPRVEVLRADGLPPTGQADLIVCNPPWLPGKASGGLDAAIYDPDSAMLKGFLRHVGQRLSASGEAWLILSDLAERIGLRQPGELANEIAAGGLKVVERLDTRPRHPRSRDAADPLHAARAGEITTLWRLQPV